jgi:hypothetical protein
MGTARFFCDIATLSNSVADMLSKCGDVVCKLHRKARHKLARMDRVAAATQEEEASRQTLLIAVAVRDAETIHCCGIQVNWGMAK